MALFIYFYKSDNKIYKRFNENEFILIIRNQFNYKSFK